MRARNPFSITSVGDTVEITADVETIHAQDFRRLIDRTLEAHRCTTSGRGGLLLGQPGVGKSHLLGRFKNWAAERKACFVYLHNVQIEPEEILRFLVRCCVSKLADDRVSRVQKTDLYEIVHAAVAKAAKDLGIEKVTRESRDQVAAQIARWLGGNDDVFSVIFHCYCGSRWAAEVMADSPQREKRERIVSAALRWLSGDVLDADDAALIGRKPQPDHDTVMMNNQQAEDVIVILARLAQETGRPFILCIDQADMMTDAQLRAFGHVLQSLINRTRNLFVLVAGVLDVLDRRIRDGAMDVAAADRLDFREPIVLTRVTRDGAREIVAARIAQFFESLDAVPRGLKKLRHDDPLFPLGARWFGRAMQDSKELRPRDVIQWSRSQWREQIDRVEKLGFTSWLAEWEGCGWDDERIEPPPPPPHPLPPLIDKAVHDKLEELRNERLLDRSQLPADAGKLRALTLAALARCQKAPPGMYTLREVIGPQHGGVDIQITEEIAGRTIVNAVQFVVTASKTSTAVALGKLAEAESADERVLVTDAERRPLCVAKTGKGAACLARLRELGEDRFHEKRLTFEECAELDALEAVIGAAASGDLELDFGPGNPSHRITEAEAVESLHRQHKYETHPLLGVFLTQRASATPPELPYPDVATFTSFVCTKLTYVIGASLTEIVRQFMKMHPPAGDCVVTEEEAFRNASEIVMKLHEAGTVHARPHGADLFLLSGPKHA